MATPEVILQTLCSPSIPIQHLGLALLRKAALAVSDASIVASWTDIIKKLVELLLVSEDTGVSSRADEVLVKLLAVDLPGNKGTGLVWRRLLEDRGVYELFFKFCSWHGDDLPGGKRAKTEGQGRLLGFVSRMSELDFGATVASRFPDIEERYKGSPGVPCQGFLDFAARHAIKAEEDVMMHMILLDFYTSLLRSSGSSSNSFRTGALDYFHFSRVHESTIGRYLAPEEYSDDPLEQTLLESKSAEYISTYAVLHPQKLMLESTPEIPGHNHPERLGSAPASAPADLGGKALPEALLNRIQHHLVTSPKTPHSPSLKLLTALSPFLLNSAYNPVSTIEKIPLSPPSAEYINALSALFTSQEVYIHYYGAHPEMWRTLLSYASALALREVSLASIDLMEKLGTGALWGLQLLLAAPGVMTFLATPNTRTGGNDPSSTAYAVAMKKWACLLAVEKALDTWGDQIAGAQEWKVIVGHRRQAGVWGSAAGGEVATLEM